MDIEFDAAKNEANIAARGISFEAARDFDMDLALVVLDERENYGEDRYIAIGYIGIRLHVLVFTPRDECIRVISLRKANKREVKAYEQATRS